MYSVQWSVFLNVHKVQSEQGWKGSKFVRNPFSWWIKKEYKSSPAIINMCVFLLSHQFNDIQTFVAMLFIVPKCLAL